MEKYIECPPLNIALKFIQMFNTTWISTQGLIFALIRRVLGRARMTLYQKKDCFHGLWWPPIQLTKSAKWNEEKSVDSFGRKLNWELDSKLGRKQTAHRMCFWAGQEEKPELQLCLLTLCSNRKVQSFPYITHLDLRAPWVFVLTTFKYVGNFCLGALFIFCGIHYSKS